MQNVSEYMLVLALCLVSPLDAALSLGTQKLQQTTTTFNSSPNCLQVGSGPPYPPKKENTGDNCSTFL